MRKGFLRKDGEEIENKTQSHPTLLMSDGQTLFASSPEANLFCGWDSSVRNLSCRGASEAQSVKHQTSARSQISRSVSSSPASGTGLTDMFSAEFLGLEGARSGRV